MEVYNQSILLFRDHQSIIADQSQKIEYLIKQTSTLKEINDSGIRMYEQLEVSFSDLESKKKETCGWKSDIGKPLRTVSKTIRIL